MKSIFLNVLGTSILFLFYLIASWSISKALGFPMERALLLGVFAALAEIRWNQVDNKW